MTKTIWTIAKMTKTIWTITKWQKPYEQLQTSSKNLQKPCEQLQKQVKQCQTPYEQLQKQFINDKSHMNNYKHNLRHDKTIWTITKTM